MRFCSQNREMTLAEFLDMQTEKVKANRRITPLCEPEDFIVQAESFAAERVGQELARKVSEALRLSAIGTADHHGGIYCAQTFQSDLLFGQILKKLGGGGGGGTKLGKVIPILSCGQVRMNSSTYQRGISIFTNRDNIHNLPIFPLTSKLQLAFSASKIDHELISRFRHHYVDLSEAGRLEKALDEILRTAYETAYAQNSVRFEDQVTRIGTALSSGLFSPSSDAPVIIYLEIESLLTPLLLRELSSRDTLTSKLLFDERFNKYFVTEVLDDEAEPLSSVLFKMVDDKGQYFRVDLTSENTLCGKDLEGNKITIPMTPQTVIDLIEQRRLVPGLFLTTLLTVFERGMTCMNGVFASMYTPRWQKHLVHMLEAEGMKQEADVIRAYDTSGYVCGPVFAVCKGDGYITPAGPVEFWMGKPDFSTVEKLMNETRLWDAQLMGLTIMYDDLVRYNEREDGWYRAITEGSKNSFKENVIINV